MANFYISDLHIRHENAIKFDNRPFESTEEMETEIARRWNATVKPEDTVYILGDFIWAKESEWPEILDKLNLNGHLVLIKGNHDPKGFSKKTRKYFEEIADYMEIVDNGRKVILSHYPMPFHRAAYRPTTWMVYGHVHLSREAVLMNQLRKQVINSRNNEHSNRGQWLNAGCMMPWVGYTPRTLDELIKGEQPYIEAGIDWLVNRPADTQDFGGGE